MNPEYGIFGVAPGTTATTNSAAVESMSHGVIFTNVALTPDGDVWWEGLSEQPPEGLTDWRGNPWSQDSGTLAAHPNSRFCLPVANVATISPDWNEGSGVPLDAILFGGRRAKNVPLVAQSLSWQHGVFMGATISSEQTAAAEGPVGKLRHDPFAMLPFCGYNMADYFAHWLSIADKTSEEDLPKIFQVNWFKKGSDGKFLWPGFAENIRVLDWIIGRLEGTNQGMESPVGIVPKAGELNTAGIDVDQGTLDELLEVDPEAWTKEVESITEFFEGFGQRMPKQLFDELAKLETRINA
jgi:phosphoenolpyruvate carboxykinase (GTP)